MTVAARHRAQFDNARDPYGARNALGITTWVAVDKSAPAGLQYGGAYELTAGTGITFSIGADKKVTINSSASGISDAPSDGNIYGRLNATWTNLGLVYATISSPTLTGDPKAPTPALSDNDTSIATTAFVKNQGYATASSPVFTGDPQAPTPATADNDTSIATTAFVKAQGYLTGNQTVTLSGDVTGSGATAITTTIANNAVTNAKLADVPTATFKGRFTGGTGDPEDLTGIQATTLLSLFTNTSNGVVPSSGGGTANFLRADGTWAAPGSSTLPTQQVFTSGSGTYTLPASCRRIEVTLIGGGAGGGGGGAGGLGTAGGNTTFGASLAANGGAVNVFYYQSGAPGTASGGNINLTGGCGQDGPSAATTQGAGGQGGETIFGGAGGGGNNRAGRAAAANTGAGGGGGGMVNATAGAGGSSGGCCMAFINSPNATYSYVVGAGGTGGAAGSGAQAGGNGAAGIIIVKEYY